MSMEGVTRIHYELQVCAPRLPPGPTCWPIVGSLLSLSENQSEDYRRLREQYGDVFTVWFGPK